LSESPSHPRWLARSGERRRRISFGADYNPDQWPREVWQDDVRLMREAHVDIVSVAIFSWARLQPTASEWDFAWLDEVLDLLHANGIAVDLATATASPPPWLTTAHPEILPVNERGEILHPGGRQHWRPTSPVFREHALALVERLAERYADHPALAAWHVSNELGCHNAWDHSEDATRAFRAWLITKYGDIATLNDSWGTEFWSQRYSTFDEIITPRQNAAAANPSQALDFKRFSSDALKEHLRVEREVLRRFTPDVPVTTNFMVMEDITAMNFADWAAEVDFVSNDHYASAKPSSRDELSFSANLTGNLAEGAPWFLMEHSTSAVNWQPVNLAKPHGAMAADALTHVAHGADAVCYFQWRQSRSGTEKFHSAMVPHVGPDSQLFRDVVQLGSTLAGLEQVAGTRRKPADIAILFDWDSWWASEQDSHHTTRFRYRDEVLSWYRAVLDAGLRADVRPVGQPFDGCRVVIAPALHVMSEALGERLARFVADGGHLLVTHNSGLVDENDRAWLGGYPGPLRDLLGIRVEEIHPLLEGDSVALDSGAHAEVWTERLEVADPAVQIIAAYVGGELGGRAAITSRAAGDGSASYVSCDLDERGRAAEVLRAAEAAGVESELPPVLHGEVELAVRTDGESEIVFLRNRSGATVELEGLVVGTAIHPVSEDEMLSLPPLGIAIIERAAALIPAR
jgi:beta-galactosidase